jgi:hypothetical protein
VSIVFKRIRVGLDVPPFPEPEILPVSAVLRQITGIELEIMSFLKRQFKLPELVEEVFEFEEPENRPHMIRVILP